MIIATISKTSGAQRWFPVKHGWMQDDETIVDHEVTVAAEAGATDVLAPDLTVVATQVVGSDLQLLIGGGLDGGRYIVHTSVTTSLNQISDDHIEFLIDDGGV